MLKVSPLLNGKKGIVDHADPSSPGRYAVLIDGADTFVSIHQKNLVLRESVIAATQCPKEYLPPGTQASGLPIDGIGMFAIRDIKAGEMIIQDVEFKGYKHDFQNPKTTKAFLKSLTPDELQVLRRLSDNGGLEMVKMFPDADSRRLKVNSLGGHIYLMLSRINHRCTRHPEFNGKSVMDKVYATRDIRCGEEITIDYENTHCIRRDEVLYTNWGIPYGSCKCVDCSYTSYIKKGLLTKDQIRPYGEICLNELHRVVECKEIRLDDGVEIFTPLVKRDANNRIIQDDSSDFCNGFVHFEAAMRKKIKERKELFDAIDNAGYICDDGTVMELPPSRKCESVISLYHRKLYVIAVKLPEFLDSIAMNNGQGNLIFRSLPQKKIDDLYQEYYDVASKLVLGDEEHDAVVCKGILTQHYGNRYNV